MVSRKIYRPKKRGLHCAAPAYLALDIHEERVGGLHEALELVLALLQLSRRVKQIDILGKHLRDSGRSGETRTSRHTYTSHPENRPHADGL